MISLEAQLSQEDRRRYRKASAMHRSATSLGIMKRCVLTGKQMGRMKCPLSTAR